MADLDEILWTTDASVHLDRSSELDARSDQSDRRRPGRKHIAPELIPLLREVNDVSLVQDDSTPMRGIALAVVLSAPVYGGLWLAIRWMMS